MTETAERVVKLQAEYDRLAKELREVEKKLSEANHELWVETAGV